MGGCISIRKVAAKKVFDVSLMAAVPIKHQLNNYPERATYKSYNLSGSNSSSSSGFFSTPSTPICKSNENIKPAKRSNRRKIRHALRSRPICDDFEDYKLMSYKKHKARNISSGYLSSNSSEFTATIEKAHNTAAVNITDNYHPTLTSESDEIATKYVNDYSLGKTSTPLVRKRSIEKLHYQNDYDKWLSDLISNYVCQLESSHLTTSNVECISPNHLNTNHSQLISNETIDEKTNEGTFQQIHLTPNVKQLIDFKLEPSVLSTVKSTPEISEEWSGGLNGSTGSNVSGSDGWKGTSFLVEIEETDTVSSISSTDYFNNNDYITEIINTTDILNEGPQIIVRTEEVLIVGLVLMLWVGAIILFFNRWGKIRMLEPYQPKFQQQHRASCLTDTLDTIPAHQRTSTTRMSMGLATNNVTIPANCQFAKCKSGIYSKGFKPFTRTRQNSVFVEPSPNRFFVARPPRRTRSAMDLHSMVFNESAESV